MKLPFKLKKNSKNNSIKVRPTLKQERNSFYDSYIYDENGNLKKYLFSKITKSFTFFNTYTSKKNPFNFSLLSFKSQLIFLLIAILLPIIINIIGTYIEPVKQLLPDGTNNSKWASRRFLISMASIGIEAGLLAYFWILYGKKNFIKLGMISFFYISVFMPLGIIILFTIFQLLPFYKTMNKVNQNGFAVLIQVLLEIVFIILILLKTDFLFKRIKEFYKDNYFIILFIVAGSFLCVGASYLFNLIPIKTHTSDNQKSLNILLKSTWTTILLGFFTIFIAPIFEELTIRNGIYTMSSNRWFGFLGSLLYFSSIHVFDAGDWEDIVFYLGTGIVLSFIFLIANGNIFYSISCHAIFNVLAFVLLVVEHHH